jgi:tetratricopeptide (TPR) repeat protein
MIISKLNIRLPLLIFTLLAVQGVSETISNVVPIVTSQSTRVDGWQSDLDLQYWSTSTFHADLSQAIVALSEAHGAEQNAILLDIAEIYLTHMLLYEASTTLDGVVRKEAGQDQRYLAMRHAVSLLAGAAIEEFDASPLTLPERPDQAFWMSLQAIAASDLDMLSANIQSSFGGLGLQSRAVLRQILPVLIEAATELDQLTYADAALRLLEELPDIASSSAGYFLRGRAEERRGNVSSALEGYISAVKGWDQYAARARLAVADMSLRNGGLGALLTAQSILQEGAEAWRGDQYELEVLKRLVRLYEATDNDVKGLLTLGKMLTRFPADRDVRSTHDQTQELLTEVYRKGREGNYPLSDWMDVHLSLLPFFRNLPQFPAHTEEFGDYVLELGATDLAANEYRRAIQLIEGREGRPLLGMKADLVRLHLKLADAQRRAGLAVEARATLDLLGKPENHSEREAYNALKAWILSDLDDGPALLQTPVAAPTPNHLRKMGQALTADKNWEESAGVFLRLWDSYPQDFSLEDATHLLIAANRSKDGAAMEKVARAFPQLTDSKAIIDLAESLRTKTPDLLPLRAEKAADRLRSLEEAFQSIKNTSNFP